MWWVWHVVGVVMDHVWLLVVVVVKMKLKVIIPQSIVFMILVVVHCVAVPLMLVVEGWKRDRWLKRKPHLLIKIICDRGE